jgi:phosphoribosylglycinamide formyltransferase 1
VIRVSIIASTGGAVYRHACENSDYLRRRIVSVITDRNCGAVDSAKALGHLVEIAPSPDSQAFSDITLAHLSGQQSDLAISFFTRQLKGRLLSEYQGRLINFHPSLLPACPGLSGFEDSIRSRTTVLGSTVHLVDRGLDTGTPLMQSLLIRPPDCNISGLRHNLFLQQCAALVQVVNWFEQSRVVLSGDEASVLNARYTLGAFVPALEHPDAITLAGTLQSA